MKIPLVRPQLGDLEVEAAARVIRSGWVTQGPEVAAFESELARFVGAAHAVAVSNCTVALELALRALGVGPGDEVATVSHSFVATANSVWAVGAKPVFVDVELDNLGMDPRLLEGALGPRTKAILCVHQLGIPCDLAAILDVARRRQLPVVEDAACAIGSEARVGGTFEKVGKPHGKIACFSFHPRKVLTTGDGGMLTTADEALAKRFRLLRQHGMSVSDAERHSSSTLVVEEYVEPGFNFRMTDIQAAIGRTQLARLDAIIAERRRIAERFVAALATNALLAPPTERANARANWQSFPARLRPGHEKKQRALLEHFLENGVAAKIGVTNAHEEPAWARHPERFAVAPGGLRASERLRREVVLLPLFHGMSLAEQDAVLAECERAARRLA